MRVVVADDSVLLREGIVRLLEDADFEVVGQAGDAEDLVRKVAAHKPDVAVVDIRMPPTQSDDGLRAALEIRRRLPQTGVLVLSQYLEEGVRARAHRRQRRGHRLPARDRVAEVERFVDAVRRVGEGARRWTRRSSRTCSGADAATIRSRGSPGASGRSWR